MPFRDPNAGDLATRIDAGIRERIEEAIDAACLESMVRSREAGGLPSPAADSPRDRAEYAANVEAFLELLRDRLASSATQEVQAVIERAAGRAGGDPVARLMAIQLALAKTLPDYWQRFEEARVLYAAGTASGGERRGLLGRLLGRG